MLHKASRIRGAPVHALDGEVGRVEEFYVDDGAWTIRYLWVHTVSWLAHRGVLIPSHAIEPEWSVAGLTARLTKEQVRNSPEMESPPAMSGLDDAQLLSHYIGYHLHAVDGGIGHVDDFLFDERWNVRYLVLDTSNFIGGKSVVISPAALHGIDRSNQKMHVTLTRDEVKQSPSFDSIDMAPGEGSRIWIM
jgi:hypothetical protein